MTVKARKNSVCSGMSSKASTPAIDRSSTDRRSWIVTTKGKQPTRGRNHLSICTKRWTNVPAVAPTAIQTSHVLKKMAIPSSPPEALTRNCRNRIVWEASVKQPMATNRTGKQKRSLIRVRIRKRPAPQIRRTQHLTSMRRPTILLSTTVGSAFPPDPNPAQGQPAAKTLLGDRFCVGRCHVCR